MLRQRHPGSVSGQYMPGGETQGSYQNIEMMKQRQIMQMRAQHSQGIQVYNFVIGSIKHPILFYFILFNFIQQFKKCFLLSF